MSERDIVRRLIHRYRTRDPFELASILGREVIEVPLKGIRGFYQYFQRNHLIYLDSALDGPERFFVCAHELGHSLLHTDVNAVYLDSQSFFITSKYEAQADRFAVDLLISDMDVSEYSVYPISTLEQIWGIRGDAIKYRFDKAQLGFKL